MKPNYSVYNNKISRNAFNFFSRKWAHDSALGWEFQNTLLRIKEIKLISFISA